MDLALQSSAYLGSTFFILERLENLALKSSDQLAIINSRLMDLGQGFSFLLFFQFCDVAEVAIIH
jgi:hypothetical protein